MKKNALTFHSADISIPLKERTRLKNWLQNLAKAHGYAVQELRYIFCSDDFLLEINRSSLDHDYYTDIITFDLRENTKSKKIVGEIYISVDRVRENASDFGVSFSTEMRRVLAHGILHLVGFKDKSPEQEAEMRREEDKALNTF
ncbi:MAG: rRNA maturation RNase YbeY [Flavobacteriales bacterium]